MVRGQTKGEDLIREVIHERGVILGREGGETEVGAILTEGGVEVIGREAPEREEGVDLHSHPETGHQSITLHGGLKHHPCTSKSH